MKQSKFLLIVIFLLLLTCGCSSSSKSPVASDVSGTNNETFTLDTLPIIAYDQDSAIMMMGAFDLTINPDSSTAELVPKRTLSMGESWVVSGISYFMNDSKGQNLRIKSVALDANTRVVLTFEIKHPFPKGNIADPPSGKNRLDLDLFDVAMVIVPKTLAPESSGLGDAYTTIVYNADGFTKDLAPVLGKNAAMPYKICFQNSDYNRFEMGMNWQSFDVVFVKRPSLQFDLYLTTGYGASATFEERLTPTYYLPEFNRKAAWKVDVIPPVWEQGNTEDKMPIRIRVYDWNHGASVGSNYPDPLHTNYIKSESDISTVRVDIPQMIDSPVTATTTDSSTNGWDDPIEYEAQIANKNNLGMGTYWGIVEVTDTRVPGSNPMEADTLIHAPYTGPREYYTLPGFSTYQAFIVNVVSPIYDWGGAWGDTGPDVGYDAAYDESTGSVYLTGYFSGSVDFDPGPGVSMRDSDGTEADIFLLKLNKYRQLEWVKTWGSGEWDEGHAIAFDPIGKCIYLTGFFSGTTDFNPDAGIDIQTNHGGYDVFLSKFSEFGAYQWSQTWGGLGLWDEGHGVCFDQTNQRIWVAGKYSDTVDFDPAGGFTRTSSTNDYEDAFINVFNADGSHAWAGSWGGVNRDYANDVAINDYNLVMVTGGFEGLVDFQPGLGTFNLTGDGIDVFINQFQASDFGWVTAKKSGGGLWDEGHAMATDGQNFYLVGWFRGASVNFNMDGGSDWQSGHTDSDWDIFMTKFDQTGAYLGSRTWGGPGVHDLGFGISVLGNEVLITGSFEETADFDPAHSNPSAIKTSNGSTDSFMSMLSSDGVYGWTYTWGGPGSEIGQATSFGSFDLFGSFTSTMDFNPDDTGSDLRTPSGQSDIFFVTMEPEGTRESEPNDFYWYANEWKPVRSVGSVNNGGDFADYWQFTSTGFDHTQIILQNDSSPRGDIDLFIYDSDGIKLIASSENQGTSDEIIGPTDMFDNGLRYLVCVESAEDGLQSNKNYSLVIIQ